MDEQNSAFASKGLHMVSAVHPEIFFAPTARISIASKGLHMVSAVHLSVLLSPSKR